MIETGTFVVVATDKRGVFAGVLDSYNREARVSVLTEARQCVYWSKESGGFVGLAGRGPQKGSRVSPTAPRVELPGTHCVAQCSAEARQQWEAEPWN